MALILPTSRCALCGERLDRPYTATSGVAFGEGHPLWRFCDAPLHLECLERWPAREAFSRGYFDSARERFMGMRTLLVETDRWLLGCGPTRHTPLPPGLTRPLGNPLPLYADVRLTDWPCRLSCDWEDWGAFVTGGFRAHLDGGALDGGALAAAERVMAEVGAHAPDLAALERLWRARAEV